MSCTFALYIAFVAPGALKKVAQCVFAKISSVQQLSPFPRVLLESQRALSHSVATRIALRELHSVRFAETPSQRLKRGPGWSQSAPLLS